eukprot:GHVQ01016250.1.p1 GENE.GHVQ01016250.1~~GHVQ01016250.1.p1  ORF type:complete len:439 (-),score=50.84 GHVQ01016250.1:975-2291(-)
MAQPSQEAISLPTQTQVSEQESTVDEHQSWHTEQPDATCSRGPHRGLVSEPLSSPPPRYIRACNGDEVAALARWERTRKWREEGNINRLLGEPQPYFELIKHHYPHFFHHSATNGCYVYIEEPGKASISRMFKEHPEMTMDILVRHCVFVTEYLWRVIDRTTPHNHNNNAEISMTPSAQRHGATDGTAFIQINHKSNFESRGTSQFLSFHCSPAAPTTQPGCEETVGTGWSTHASSDSGAAKCNCPGDKVRCFVNSSELLASEYYSNRQLISIFDVTGARLPELSGPILKLFQNCTEVIQTHYPDRLFRVFVFNAPWWFNAAWTMLSPWLDSRTKNKVVVLSGKVESQRQQLVEAVGADNLPEKYGGRSRQRNWSEGAEMNDKVRVRSKSWKRRDRYTSNNKAERANEDQSEEEASLLEYVRNLNRQHEVQAIMPVLN